jgi:hypothetical protein
MEINALGKHTKAAIDRLCAAKNYSTFTGCAEKEDRKSPIIPTDKGFAALPQLLSNSWGR